MFDNANVSAAGISRAPTPSINFAEDHSFKFSKHNSISPSPKNL